LQLNIKASQLEYIRF